MVCCMSPYGVVSVALRCGVRRHVIQSLLLYGMVYVVLLYSLCCLIICCLSPYDIFSVALRSGVRLLVMQSLLPYCLVSVAF